MKKISCMVSDSFFEEIKDRIKKTNRSMGGEILTLSQQMIEQEKGTQKVIFPDDLNELIVEIAKRRGGGL